MGKANKAVDGRALKKGEKQKEGVRLEKSLHDGMVSFSVWRRRAYETGEAHKEGAGRSVEVGRHRHSIEQGGETRRAGQQPSRRLNGVVRCGG